MAVYDKDKQEWEVPVTSLQSLIPKFCDLDSVDLTLCKEGKLAPTHVYDIEPLKTTPYQYQTEGIQYCLNHPNALLLDEPGLGKSLQAIYTAQTLYRMGKIEHCLIICGVNTLKTNWKREITKHSDLSCRILGERTNTKGQYVIGSVEDRLDQLNHKIKEFFIITNIETLRNNDIVKAINGGKNKLDFIIVDEVHVCKNPQSQQGKNLLKLKAKYKLAMTGTLLLNDPMDCYVPLKWIGEENATYTNYKYYYCNFGGPFNNIPMGYKHLDVLKDQLQGCSLRRTKDLLDLPPKTIINEIVDMNDTHRHFYDDIKDGIVSSVDKVHISTANLLAMVGRLRQATVLPSMLTSLSVPSSKMERALQLIEEITTNGSKVVVFSTYKESAEYLYKQLSHIGALLCTGNQKDQEINDAIQNF